MSITISYTVRNAKRLLFLLVGFELFLVTAHLVIHILYPTIAWGPFRQLFNLDLEVTIPAWFSSIQLFMVGVLLLAASQSNQQRKHLSSRFIFFAGIVFIFLSADEAATIHENLTRIALKLDLRWLLFKGGPGAWITVYLLLGLILLLVLRHHLLALWKHYRQETLKVIMGWIVFLVGVVGFEVISYSIRASSSSILYEIEVLFEEFFEMSGISLILYGVMLLTKKTSTKARPKS